jgi:hypothetical protein
MEHIGSSIQELETGGNAPQTEAILRKLKDLDAGRISGNDGVVIRKAVFALLTMVSDLEGRVNTLEGELAKHGG